MLSKSIFILFAAVLLIVCAGALIGKVLSTQPQYVQVEADNVFVFPDDNRFVLALTSGSYTVEGNAVPTGCYLLTPPADGEEHGTAKLVWFGCE